MWLCLMYASERIYIYKQICFSFQTHNCREKVKCGSVMFRMSFLYRRTFEIVRAHEMRYGGARIFFACKMSQSERNETCGDTIFRAPKKVHDFVWDLSFCTNSNGQIYSPKSKVDFLHVKFEFSPRFSVRLRRINGMEISTVCTSRCSF